MTSAQTADFSPFSHKGGTLRRAANILAALRCAKGGTAAVEFALAAPVLLGLLVPVADLGIAYSEKNQIQQAAQAGAQYAAFHPWNTNSPTDIANAVRAASNLPGVAATPAPTQLCGCPSGSAVTAASCTSTCSTGESAGYYVALHLQATDFRHMHVQDQAARRECGRCIQEMRGRCETHHVVLAAQLTGQQPAHLLVVINDVHPRQCVH